ncbi:RhoGAP-domain-containing protein [Coprinopsis marcescibilis]|uniref:RhoGAP-domain-containing protein n=1 Tax=Coprinopsis marcescibilis TaxID=230819 RepID=A0A5C3KQF6_COPMA|nr:RhoGAP-domain-containing protein [Coprinopsis marcescibilis]
MSLPVDLPLREQSHFNIQQNGREAQPEQSLDDRLCPGCKKSAVSENGGLVVAFGSSFFHVDCFKCAKCRNQVNADTNLLLLSDGSPICANCSYSCNVCRQPILDEAIMAGDDSYHAHCFKCKVCKSRIDELVFAKTSQGIYCMKCHNERMIRIRKHTQKKAEREKAQGGSGSSKSRERDARNYHRENTKPSSPSYNSLSHNISSQPSNSQASLTQQDDSRRQQNISRTPSLATSQPGNSLNAQKSSPPIAPVFSSTPSVSVTVDPPLNPNPEPANGDKQHPTKQQTLPLPSNNSSWSSRRSSSYDDGSMKSWSELGFQTAPSSNSNGLSVTSRRDKRRSINPGLSLTPFSETTPGAGTNGSDSRPRSATLDQFVTSDLRSDSPRGGSDANDRRTSNSSSLHSVHSSSSQVPRDITRSRSPSFADHQDDTIVLRSPIVESYGDSTHVPNPGGPHGERMSAGLSPNNPRSNFAAQQLQRLSTTSSLSADTHRSGGGSRSASPAYRADVPHGIESGTDTDDDGPSMNQSRRDSLPPAPPPKDGRLDTKSPSLDGHDQDLSDAETSQISRTSHSTYIAPALPPIRMSLTSDLSDFLNGKSISDLAAMSEQPFSRASFLQNSGSQNLSDIVEEGGGSLPDTPTMEASSSNGHGSSGHDEKLDSLSDLNGFSSSQSSTISQSTVVAPSPAPIPRQKASAADIVTTRLREALANSKERGAQQLKLDRAFVEAILSTLDSRTSDLAQMKNKFDGVRRASKQYIEGFNVAQTEYDRELKARRDVEREVTRLRVLLSGQAAQLSALSGDTKRQEVRQQMSKEITDNLDGLESDVSRLKTERDMALAEMEEIAVAKSTPDAAPASLGRTFTKRLDGIKNQYQRDLLSLQQKRGQLNREIAELKAVRDVFLEETAVLNARNEELAQLSTVYLRNGDNARVPGAAVPRAPAFQQQQSGAPSLSTSTSSTSTIYEEPSDPRFIKVIKPDQELATPAKKFKWPGSSKTKDAVASPSNNGNGVEFTKSKAHIEHNFQQVSLLNFTRCKHCGDKMWGSQLRCTVCSTSIHVRCIAYVQIPCMHQQPTTSTIKEPEPPAVPLPPSMFGRDLVEQVHADSKDGERQIPVIVEKCVNAVESRALDYEGIYRKTGGSGLQRTITQLFERGDYDSFDLEDTDRFNDICSVTSVLKNYFRSLPVPLLTFDLHDQFIATIMQRDSPSKHEALIDLVDQLPTEHYDTVRKLMIHLNHVRLQSDINRMTARNLGVVFGPTLMRSRDPGAEFSDMAGKALFIEWLIENAPEIFEETD